MKRSWTHGTKEDFPVIAGEKLTDCLKKSVVHVKNYLSQPLDSTQGYIVNLEDYSVRRTFVRLPREFYKPEDFAYPRYDYGCGHLPGSLIYFFFFFDFNIGFFNFPLF